MFTGWMKTCPKFSTRKIQPAQGVNFPLASLNNFLDRCTFKNKLGTILRHSTNVSKSHRDTSGKEIQQTNLFLLLSILLKKSSGVEKTEKRSIAQIALRDSFPFMAIRKYSPVWLRYHENKWSFCKCCCCKKEKEEKNAVLPATVRNNKFLKGQVKDDNHFLHFYSCFAGFLIIKYCVMTCFGIWEETKRRKIRVLVNNTFYRKVIQTTE